MRYNLFEQEMPGWLPLYRAHSEQRLKALKVEGLGLVALVQHPAQMERRLDDQMQHGLLLLKSAQALVPLVDLCQEVLQVWAHFA